MYCTICLDENCNVYHNICSQCNNCICKNCYNGNEVHNLNNCSVCRTRLQKKTHFTYQSFTYSLYFYHHSIIHILINIILANITFYHNFPNDITIKSIPQDRTTFLLLLNFCNCILLPYIYSIFNEYITLNYLYSIISLVLCQIINHVDGKDLRFFYMMYCMMYLYTLCIGHFTLIILKQMCILIRQKYIQFIHESKINKLTIYLTHYNTPV